MTHPRRLLALVAFVLVLVPAAADAQAAHAPRPTSPAISADDLRTRVHAFADDSLGGRETGTPYARKAEEYIARELRRLRLEPAGENGTYFQEVPLIRRTLEPGPGLAVNGVALAPWTDFAPRDQGDGTRALAGAEVIFGGRWGDQASLITDAQAAGRVVLLLPARGWDGRAVWQVSRSAATARFRSAAGIAFVSLDLLPPRLRAMHREAGVTPKRDAERVDVPAFLYVTAAAARRMLGADPAATAVGRTGRTLEGGYRFRDEPVPARNVVATLRGRDRRLRGQYVALGAHHDHAGFAARPVDHDSVRVFNRLFRRGGAETPSPRELTEAQRSRLRAALDSARAVRPPRPDSIHNGADDDASGAMALLEIAEALARREERPRRSLLFVWHTAEELGLYGSEHFTDHPTVPLDSVVAQLNVDMIGRGGAEDLPGGGPGYLQVVGARRLSTALGEVVETVNRETGGRLRLDYTYDADGHPAQYYCRSDHFNYARRGIPVAFFSTGGHPEYHMVTDEPQYLDYDGLARVTRFIRDVAARVADLDHRPAVDGRVTEPGRPCRQ